MSNSATLSVDGKTITLPTIIGTEGEKAIDIRKLRTDSEYITYDDGYANTGSCQSSITFIDGEQGILRYRGYPIEEIAEHADFIETAYLVIYGELPTAEQRRIFSSQVRSQAPVHIGMRHFFETFPASSSPMAILSAMLNSLGCYYPHMASNNRQQDCEYFDESAAILISKVRTLAAMSYRQKQGLPFIYPKPDLPYCENFLHMMFSEPYRDYVATPEVARALNLMLLLHADHEQNCSTSTVRMVASGGANLFASVSAGVSALWGPLHGGANAAVVDMLEHIRRTGDDGHGFIAEVKAGKRLLMGFGHRVYKNYDPRAKIFREATARVLQQLKINDPILDIAKRLEEVALSDPYFIDRKLYPNVDFYSGILLRAIGLPTDMFTVMFAIGRMPGWIANWREIAQNTKTKIHRPRQIYTGHTLRHYTPIEKRS
jgi:citrate synthase